jgi:uncharacterized membrane protein
MNRPHLSATGTQYLKRVEDLLADIDDDDRASLLADLADQLGELPESEVSERLGTPEAFAGEYRHSAGLEIPLPSPPRSQSAAIAMTLSALALPFGVLVLLSFGGQLVFGPFVLAIEWILARVSPRPLRIAWSLLAALLAGEIGYLLTDTHVMEGVPAVVVGVVVAGLITLLFNRTTRHNADPPSSNDLDPVHRR